MRKLYLITGGTGHVGQTVIQQLLGQHGHDIRVLVLPDDKTPLPAAVERVPGNVCDRNSLLPFMDTDGYDTAVLYHLAAYITIASKEDPKVWQVNVEGTRNVMDCALQLGIPRVVYVSSVHAIAEKPRPDVIAETRQFSPGTVHGQYAKSKAMAADIVLQYARRGLNVSIVHPSGIIGPGDSQKTNHLTRTIAAMASGHIPVSISGGYDFVDVRDVAEGIIRCETKGRPGECYILSGHFITVAGLMRIISRYTGRRFMPLYVPKFVMKAAAYLGERLSLLFRRVPLLTPYSLFTLYSNALFSHRKATRQLGYRPRALRASVRSVLLSLGYRRKSKTTA